MLVNLVRFLFVIFAVIAGYHYAGLFYSRLTDPIGGAAMGFSLAITLIAAEHAFRKRFTRSLVAFLIGLAAGLLLSYLAMAVLEQIIQLQSALRASKVAVTLVITYLVVMLVIQHADRFRVLVPFVEFRHDQIDEGPMVVDSSSLADERLHSLTGRGILNRRLLVHIAVLSDCERRIASGQGIDKARAQMALDTLERLQREHPTHVIVDATEIPGARNLEEILIRLTRLNDCPLFSNDTKLVAHARSEGLRVVSPDEIDRALHPPLTPGQVVTVLIERHGENEGQGTGHLADGSLVVVSDAGKHVGNYVRATVLRFHFTGQGRIVFADYAGKEG
jgi:uncharacterized protein YacL